MKRRGVLSSLAAVVALTVLAPVAQAAKKTSDVNIVNKSDWAIAELYLSPVDETEWGPDQLAEHVIGPGESFKLTKVPCDTWDVRLVDEDGDECIVGSVDICANNETWTITSKDLLRCQAAGE
jgi:hypothetical protein